MKKLLTILVLIMLIISFFQITSMYALYKEQLQGEYNTLLGAWTIKVNEKDVTTSGQVETFTIANNQLGYVTSDYIQAGKIAPNGQAYFDIVIDPSNVYTDENNTEHTIYNDVSIVYQINMESIDIPNVQIKLLTVDNYFKKTGESDITNTLVHQDGNIYTAVIPIDKITAGYKNHLRLNFKWANEDANNSTDSILGFAENPTNKNITWTSSDDAIATVANGVITAVAEGTATITVTTVDGSYTDTCTVTVTKDVLNETVQPTAIALNTTTLTLKKGETEMLLATQAPGNVSNKNITWASSDTEVATISNGVVTAIKEGTATITVTTADGSYSNTCTVTVTEENVDKQLQVIGVELDKTELTIKTGETMVLTPKMWSQNEKLSIPLEINLKQYTGEVIGNES